MSGLLNTLARTLDPRTITPVGFGNPANATAWVWFRRVLRNDSRSPDWQSHPRIVVDQIPGGGVDRQNIGYDPDSLTLTVEVESAADAEILRTLVGTESTLTLPDLQYGAGDGSVSAVHGTAYRTYTSVFLAAAVPEGGTIRNSFWFSCTFEKART